MQHASNATVRGSGSASAPEKSLGAVSLARAEQAIASVAQSG